MSAREPLKTRRAHELASTEFRGAPYEVGFGRFEDGRLAEVFIDCQAKGLTAISDDAKDVAVLISIALQFGAPVEVIRDSLTRTSDGEATGIGGHVLDLLENSNPSASPKA